MNYVCKKTLLNIEERNFKLCFGRIDMFFTKEIINSIECIDYF